MLIELSCILVRNVAMIPTFITTFATFKHQKSMSTIILGIESSCDDTSAAVIKDGYLLSNVVSS